MPPPNRGVAQVATVGEEMFVAAVTSDTPTGTLRASETLISFCGFPDDPCGGLVHVFARLLFRPTLGMESVHLTAKGSIARVTWFGLADWASKPEGNCLHVQSLRRVVKHR